MDKDIKEILENNSKDNMPDLWDKIESKLENKNKINKKRFLAVAAVIAVVFSMVLMRNVLNEVLSENEEVVLMDEGINEAIDNGTDGGVDRGIEGSVNDEKDILMGGEGAISYGLYSSMEERILKDGLDNKGVFGDIDLEKVLDNKILVDVLGINNQSSEHNAMSNYKESDSIIYGKVKSVKSYIGEGLEIKSDIYIQVIEDYKNNIEKDEIIKVNSNGGEVSYDEFISKLDKGSDLKKKYEKKENKSKMFIQLGDNNIPQYTAYEHVLVYVDKVNKGESYSGDNEDVTETYEAVIKQYVNPNTKELYKYNYSNENGKHNLKKESIDNLDNFKR